MLIIGIELEVDSLDKIALLDSMISPMTKCNGKVIFANDKSRVMRVSSKLRGILLNLRTCHLSAQYIQVRFVTAIGNNIGKAGENMKVAQIIAIIYAILESIVNSVPTYKSS